MQTSCDMIFQTMKFDGSYRELQRLFHGYGEWYDLGVEKRFVRPNCDCIIWWEDTGAILVSEELKEKQVYRRDKLSLLPAAAPHRKSGRWASITKGEYRGLSLPQYFFRDPFGFVDALGEDDAFEGELECNAAEILGKAANILAWKPPVEKRFVVHRCDAYGRYMGFTLELRGDFLDRRRGRQMVDFLIDVMVAGDIASASRLGRDSWKKSNEAFARSLMNVVDGDMPREWDKERCEDFFNNEANFVLP